MATWNDYFKGILQKTVNSYLILLNLDDKPGDLDIIEKELLKMTSFFNVMINKLDSENHHSKDLLALKPLLEYYIDTYYFENEITTISSLYSQDSNRIKNIRLKILESFNDKKLMSKIKTIIEEL
ncbi:MAG: hypothetical protein KC483_07550 [Nitrosarchaeum sp.]|nr:hypothetical protein [Nitrosarchaeum sp.]MCA9820157.1 hypothetical protein [Nitrosarchaeum sp.]